LTQSGHCPINETASVATPEHWSIKSEITGHLFRNTHRVVIEVIDLRDFPQAARKYGIRVIPTQILFDAEGLEIWRHEGFLPKDTIISRFKEIGVEPVGD
jgi:thioredoxin-related protein